jgi:hypothetical protein
MVGAVLGQNSLCQAVEVPEVPVQVPSAQLGHAQVVVHPESASMKVHSSQAEHNCMQTQYMRRGATSVVSSLRQVKLGIVEVRMRNLTRWDFHNSWSYPNC